jgi:uncharacterized membrane protein YeaQ/YmgE (transglycosylase-associated protein family)
VAGRRTSKPLISGALFVAVAFVAGFITAAFADGWVLPVVAGVVAGAVAEWVYAAVVWKARRRSRGG